MRSYTLVFVMLVALVDTASAIDIYRREGASGRATEFSDKPRPGAEKIEIRVPLRPAVAPASGTPGASPGSAPPAPEAPVKYDVVRFLAPANDATLRDNEGNVAVTVELQPPLQINYGHQLAVLMDGRLLEAPGTKAAFNLTNVDRGSHVLKAVVVDSMGKTLAEAEKVTFHLHRTIIRKPSGD